MGLKLRYPSSDWDDLLDEALTRCRIGKRPSSDEIVRACEVLADRKSEEVEVATAFAELSERFPGDPDEPTEELIDRAAKAGDPVALAVRSIVAAGEHTEDEHKQMLLQAIRAANASLL
jgi:hypothetical protein